jgi:hypothetical protein
MNTKAGPAGGRTRECPPWRHGRLAAVLAVLAVFAAACSSGPTQQSRTLGLVLTRCMHEHGVSDFPQSTVTVSNGNMNVSPSGGSLSFFRSATVRAGFRACQPAVERAAADGQGAG